MFLTRVFLTIAAILAGLSVAAGAFASHALKERLTERSLEIFETAARYQMYHALALFLVAVLLSRVESAPSTLSAAGYAFIAGIAIFSGSLYALSLTGIKWLGAITPLGGAAFLVAGVVWRSPPGVSNNALTVFLSDRGLPIPSSKPFRSVE